MGGFLLGTVVGGIVGGITGVVVASRLSQPGAANEEGTVTKIDNKSEGKVTKKRQLRAATEQNMEVARRGLEDKIAQLNEAIDDVRQQLGAVNGNGDSGEQSVPRKG